MTAQKTIAFDLRYVGRAYGGITSGALNLLAALARGGDEFRFQAIINPGQEDLITRYVGEPIPGVELVPLRFDILSAASQLLLPGLLRRARVALYHSPMYMGLLLPGRPKVVITVYDLTVYLHPESAPRGRSVRFYPAFAFALRHSLQSADVILTSSRVAAAEISQTFPRVASRISVVPVPVNPLFFQALDPDEVARVRREYAPAVRLILYVGRLNPYKNPVSLVKAVAQLRGRGLDVGLVIAGREDSYYHAPERAARELGIEQFVRRTGYVEISTLRALFQAADVLVLPSTFEGFGLPPVEAMASGTPVVCANRAALPEIMGDAALLVEPEDPASIAAGIERVLTEPSLRAELIRRGRQRAQLFTRETAGEQVRAVYRRLLSS